MTPPLDSTDDLLRIVPAPSEEAKALGNLSAIIVEPDRAWVHPGALHGKSPIEQGVRWVASKDEAPDAKPYWIAWVTLGRHDGRRGYRSIRVSPMWIDTEAKVGYKHLPTHVNDMKAALDGDIDIRILPASARRALLAELKSRGLQYWKDALPEFKAAFREE